MDKLLFAICLGGAVALGFYAIFQLFAQTPGEDRTYKDRPPLLFRLFWPLIQLIAASFRWALSARSEKRYLLALQRAGQSYALTPAQFFAGKLVSAAIGLLFGWLIVGMLGSSSLVIPVGLGVFAFFYPDLWLKDITKKRNLVILKSLPFFIDLLILSVEAGLNLSGALQQAVNRSRPGPLVNEINRVLRDVRAGKSRIDALRDFSERLDFTPVTSFVSALVQGDRTGSNLGPILRAQADQRRIERFLRAEKLAMEAPVKMLGPLIMFIFPCTFIVIGFPIVMKFMASGL
ncbi:type II secretion system F family protein [Corticibacter populi]|uniref:Type II secretion system F family protein n=1 Tax=Corticibacter populi TaxID=1550736 RepID=A0A3M6QPZ7_9BURK|nr:type II secretion system F family protein [Corticibacter populi]RMX04871.1 type II secretion system F family protein [Corticibacter populi]RZS33706.1 tight adherence protein C [Corticibacter populi]